MIPKSTSGKTTKYSGLVKNVKEKSPQQTEEPRITPEQVTKAFEAFGFTPNERNHNDIAYWTTKGQSEGVKLIEELHKRRMDIIAKEDEEEKAESAKKKEAEKRQGEESGAKIALPRLNDTELAALFDEYGIPAPDPEWARTHLPNDPKKIRSILEMQRKTADDMLKKHAKNTVNAMPETPKNQPMQMGGMGGYSGRGGPVQDPMSMQGDMVGGDTPITPFFVGDHALVRITNPTNANGGTLWLVDAKKKVLRPILSEKALDAAFEDPETAKGSITTLSSKALGPGGPLEGFTPLNQDKAMRADGTMDDIEFSPAQLQKHYGKPANPNGENKSLSILDGLFSQINQQK